MIVRRGDDEGGEYHGLVAIVPGKEGNSDSPMLNMDGQVVGLVYGGQPLEQPVEGDPPKIASPEARVYLMPESLELALAIEEAMKSTADWIKIDGEG